MSGEPGSSLLVTPTMIEQMKLPIANSYNPVRELVQIMKPDEKNGGGFYHLPNVQKNYGEPDFYDIWLLTDKIENKEQ